MALTDTLIKHAKPGTKDYKIADGEGLHLLVKTSGVKLWRVSYRYLEKQKTLSLGAYPIVGLRDARDKLSEARKLLSNGIDPNEHKKKQIKAAKFARDNTFKSVGKAWFKTIEGKGFSETTLEKKKWLLDDLIYPVLGKRPMPEITPAEILDLLSDIEASGRLETTKRVRQTIGAIFRFGHVKGRSGPDPTPSLRGMIKAPRVTSHPAIIREDQFGKLLRDIDQYPTLIVRLALKFHALTFPRPVELRQATWEQISLEDSVWRLPEEVMKMRRPHDVPLCAAARGILKEASALYKHRGLTGYIFPSPQSWREPMSENCLNQALWSMGYKGIHTVHGFRSSMSSMANERAIGREVVIEFQLSHFEENETKRAYNRAQYWDERVKFMRDWSKFMLS